MKNINFKSDETAIFALGGLGEVGKNMYCIEDNNNIIIIDCGIKFPGPDLLGIDYIINDFTYLKQNEDKIKALIVTHGHEDHIGAIPFLLKQLKIPQIICSEITAAFIINKIKDKGGKSTEILIFDEKQPIKLETFTLNFIPVVHSIPGSCAVHVMTKNGTFMYTGDFRLDYTPIGKPFDLHKMLSLTGTKKGLTCLLSDSTNSLVSRVSSSERDINKNLDKIFANTDKRIIASTFASSLDRVKSIMELSAKHKRKVIIFGRSMEKGINIALRTKYIDFARNNIITMDQAKNLKPSEITIICTGSQGEDLAALSRIASGQHKQVKLTPQDLVIFSSSPIPGNSNSVNKLISKLVRSNVEIFINTPEFPIHASGHGTKEDLKAVLAFTSPKYFFPAHGEFKMLKEHATVAEQTGVNPDNIFISKNGDVIAFKNGRARRAGTVHTGICLVDGDRIDKSLESSFIQERRELSSDGLVSISLVLDRKNKCIKKPYVLSKGFIYTADNVEMMKKLDGILIKNMNNLDKEMSIEEVKELIVSLTSKFLFDSTKRNPIVIPVVSVI